MDVEVHVDGPGGPVQAGHVDPLERTSRIDAGGDRHHLAVGYGHITNGADLVPRIDDMAALQQQIVLRLRLGVGDRGKHETHAGHPLHSVILVIRSASSFGQPRRYSCLLALHFTFRYSPISTAPAISYPVTFTAKRQLYKSPCRSLKLLENWTRL